jgi:hypothetical protein
VVADDSHNGEATQAVKGWFVAESTWIFHRNSARDYQP